MANTGYTDSFGNSWDGGFNWQEVVNRLSGTNPTPTDTNTRGENTDPYTGGTSFGTPTTSVTGYSSKGQADAPATNTPFNSRTLTSSQDLSGAPSVIGDSDRSGLNTNTPFNSKTLTGSRDISGAPSIIGASDRTPAPTAATGYMLSGGSGTFGYHYDPAKGMYVDAQGNPANQAPQPTGYTPNANPAVPAGYNPYGLSGSGLQSNPAYTPAPGSGFLPQNLNPNYFATPEAAQAIAQQLGGTVVSRNYGVGGSSPDQLFIQLPNGLMVNAGNLLSIYQNPVFQQNQNVMQGEVLKLLNSGLNPDTMQPVQTQGAFTMGPDGKPTYNTGASYKYPEQTLVPLAQYNAQNAALNRPPVTTGPISPLSSGTPTQYPTQQQQQGNNYSDFRQFPGGSGYYYNPVTGQWQPNRETYNAMAQLGQYFQMLTGGQNLLSQQSNQGGGSDLATIMPLLLALLGQQEPQGALYRRSQYPRFP